MVLDGLYLLAMLCWCCVSVGYMCCLYYGVFVGFPLCWNVPVGVDGLYLLAMLCWCRVSVVYMCCLYYGVFVGVRLCWGVFARVGG